MGCERGAGAWKEEHYYWISWVERAEIVTVLWVYGCIYSIMFQDSVIVTTQYYLQISCTTKILRQIKNTILISQQRSLQLSHIVLQPLQILIYFLVVEIQIFAFLL